MRISKVILFLVLVLHGQTVELIVHEDKNPTIIAAQMVEMYLDTRLTPEDPLLTGFPALYNHRSLPTPPSCLIWCSA